LKDLIKSQAYGLAQIVYSEKMREKFESNIDDQLTGLEIFASQRKIDEFTELYSKLVSDTPTTPTTTILTPAVSESIARNLMLFDNEKEKQRRLEMAERLLKRTMESSIMLTAKLFDSLVFVFTESQQWRQLIDMLTSINNRNCAPEVKTLNYLKKNLLYCFEPQTRQQLKEQIEHLEDNFFTNVNTQEVKAGDGEPEEPEGAKDKVGEKKQYKKREMAESAVKQTYRNERP
jgi:hypothetical protein